MQSAADRRSSRRSILPALIVGGIAAVLLVGPGVVAAVHAPRAVDAPFFPRVVASYSWFTPMLAAAPVDAASMVYQNGLGVEFLDVPQSVLLGADGSGYRRLGAAEARTTPADQGDPADAVLSPDGTFVVIGGPGGQGSVEMLTLGTGERRTFPVGEQRSAIPVGIGADGVSVLLLTSASELSPYTDRDFRLHGELAMLDLVTGELRTFDAVTDAGAAALSPEGSQIAASTADGVVLVDAATGAVSDAVLRGRFVALDGDAWSPDGRRFAAVTEGGLQIVDASGTEAVQTLALADDEYGSAIGWRDDRTVLLHTGDGSGSNESAFSWVDLDTTERTEFSTYTPDLTGASLGGPDAARDLVARWEVADRPVDRGPVPLLLGLAGAAAAGLVAWVLTPRRKRPAPVENAEDLEPAEPVRT